MVDGEDTVMWWSKVQNRCLTRRVQRIALRDKASKRMSKWEANQMSAALMLRSASEVNERFRKWRRLQKKKKRDSGK